MSALLIGDLLVDPAPQYSVETENHFRQSKDRIFPIPDSISTSDFLNYWVEQGFDGLTEKLELRVVKKIARRVLALGRIKNLEVYENLLSQLQRLDGRCRYWRSLEITKRTLLRLERPTAHLAPPSLTFNSSRPDAYAP